jgi:hypothetical protein
MRKLLLAFIFSIPVGFIYAQPDKASDALQKDLKRKLDVKENGWTKGGLLNIGINQAMLENWAAGGERMSLAANGVFNGYVTRIKGSTIWENTLDMYYGLNYVASNSFVPRKLDDRIDFSSRFGLQPQSWTSSKSKFKRSTYLMGLFRFQSQFTEGYNYAEPNWELNPISEFMAPGYFTLALGAEYRPNENFSVFYSPLAARVTVVKSKYTALAAAYGVDKGNTSRFELGSYLTTKYRAKLSKNIQYNTRLDLYSNYLAKNRTTSDGITYKDNPGNVDILWDNFFAMKINKFIGAGLGFTMIYDNDQPGQKLKNNNTEYGPMGWWQLKQVLNVGFSYKL